MPIIQIRDVPAQVHSALAARAELKGVSLSEYLRELLTRTAELPAPEELTARVKARGPAPLSEPSEVLVRRLRDSQ